MLTLSNSSDDTVTFGRTATRTQKTTAPRAHDAFRGRLPSSGLPAFRLPAAVPALSGGDNVTLNRSMSVVALSAAAAWAQTVVDLKTQVKNADFSALPATKPVQVGTTLPASCTTGQLFFKSDGSGGANLYGCVQNTWALQGGAAAVKALLGSGARIPTASGGFSANAIPIVDAGGTQVDSGCAAVGGSLSCSSGAPTRIGVTKGSAPTDTVIGGVTYDAVLFLDTDNVWKILLQDGSVILPGGSGAMVTAAAIAEAAYCADTSASANIVACVIDTAFPSYAAGHAIWVKMAHTNTGPATININALGPVAITKNGSAPLSGGDLTAGGMYLLLHDGARYQAQLGGAGSGSSNVITPFSAAPVLTCPSATAGAITNFKLSTAMTANIDNIAFSGCTPGQLMTVKFTQAHAGGPYTVGGLPPGAPQISPYPDVSTTYLFYQDAIAAQFLSVVPDSGPATCAERGAPAGNPPAGSIYTWCDSTDHTFAVKTSDGTIRKMGSGSTASAPYYSPLFTSQTSATIPGTTHRFTSTPCALAAMVYDNSTPRQLLAPDGVPPLTVDPATCDVTVNFAAATTFYVAINGGTGPAGPTGAPGTAGANGQSVLVTSESAGANCAYGGQKLVSAGGTSYVCNGAPGSGSGTVTHTAGALLSGNVITGNGGADLQDGGIAAADIQRLSQNQTVSGNRTFVGSIDACGATHTTPAKTGLAAAKPATCAVGEEYFASDVAAGQNKFYCTATNTWTQQSGGGGGSVTPGSGISVSGGAVSFNPLDRTVAWKLDTFCGGQAGSTSTDAVGELGWQLAATNSGTPAVSNLQYTNIDANHPCGVKLAAPSSAGNGAYLSLRGGWVSDAMASAKLRPTAMEYQLAVSSTNNIKFYLCFLCSAPYSVALGNGTPGCWLRYDTTLGTPDTGWMAACSDGNSQTASPLAGTLDTGIHRINLSWTAAGSYVFSMDGGPPTTIMKPITGGTILKTGIAVSNDSSSTASAAYIYKFAMLQTGLVMN